MQTTILKTSQPEAYTQALRTLQAAGLVAFPTDTVYGLGCLAGNPAGIEALYVVKSRERGKAIPILLGDLADLPQVTTGLSAVAGRLAQRFWPGPLTLVVPRSPDLPEAISPLPTVGVRIPDHPAALVLLRQAGPMAVTSANRSGGANTCNAAEVLAQLGGLIPLLLDGGDTPGGDPSTVVDCSSEEWKILRPGPISAEMLQEALS